MTERLCRIEGNQIVEYDAAFQIGSTPEPESGKFVHLGDGYIHSVGGVIFNHTVKLSFYMYFPDRTYKRWKNNVR